MAAYGRLKTTVRALEGIGSQTLKGFEFSFLIDGCPVLRDFVRSSEFSSWRSQFEQHNKLNLQVYDKNWGSWGYRQWTDGIATAKGRYVTFCANDDFLLPDHLSTYHEGAVEAGTDIVYFNSLLQFPGFPQHLRNTQLIISHIGHSEIIVRTEVARLAEPHLPAYGHDWFFIDDLLKKGATAAKCLRTPTYCVRHDGD